MLIGKRLSPVRPFSGGEHLRWRSSSAATFTGGLHRWGDHSPVASLLRWRPSPVGDLNRSRPSRCRPSRWEVRRCCSFTGGRASPVAVLTGAGLQRRRCSPLAAFTGGRPSPSPVATFIEIKLISEKILVLQFSSCNSVFQKPRHENAGGDFQESDEST